MANEHKIPKKRTKQFSGKFEIDPKTGRWEWTSSKNSQGYGHITIMNDHYRAHRVSYAFAYGKIPDGKIICHKCHNPSCIRPDHLYAGTYVDNAQDAVDRGTIGELGKENAKEIREKYSTGNYIQSDLANEYGISNSLVCHVIKGKKWKSAGGPMGEDIDKIARANERNSSGPAKLTPEDVIVIRGKYNTGNYERDELADEYEVDVTNINKIINWETWKPHTIAERMAAKKQGVEA